MKLNLRLIGVLIALGTFSAEAQALESVTIGGTGCVAVADNQSIKPINGQKNIYQIPISIIANKKAGVTIDRKVCSFRIPVSVGPHEKVILFDAKQRLKTVVNAKTKMEWSQSLTFVGNSSANQVIKQIAAKSTPVKFDKVLLRKGLIAESQCGQQAMISGSSTILTTGPSAANSIAGDLEIGIDILPCN